MIRTTGSDPEFTDRRGSRAVARQWYENADSRRTCEEYEKQYSRLPRLLFQELALAHVVREKPSVLETAPGFGLCLKALASSVGTSNLVVVTADDQLKQGTQRFDLILAYSILRLKQEPTAFLEALAARLAPGGTACLVDFSGDISDELRTHLLDRVVADDQRRYLDDQLSAAPNLACVETWLAGAGICTYRLATAGLFGYPAQSREAMKIMSARPNIIPILMELAQSGFRTRRAADVVFYLSFSRQTED